MSASWILKHTHILLKLTHKSISHNELVKITKLSQLRQLKAIKANFLQFYNTSIKTSN